MFTVLPAAVLPMPLSMPFMVLVVAPLAKIMVLLVMSMFDEVPVVLPKMPRSVLTTVEASTAVEVVADV